MSDEITLAVSRQTHVSAKIPEGLVPDMQITYEEIGRMLRPTDAYVDYYLGHGAVEYHTTHVVVSGMNVKKDGTVGVQRKRARFSEELGLPGWLTDLVRENKPTV